MKSLKRSTVSAICTQHINSIQIDLQTKVCFEKKLLCLVSLSYCLVFQEILLGLKQKIEGEHVFPGCQARDIHSVNMCSLVVRLATYICVLSVVCEHTTEGRNDQHTLKLWLKGLL